jgi:hypothetical protein
VAGANRLSGLGRGRGLRDWSDVTDLISTGITTAGQVAQVALKPPTYSSITTPYGTSISSYGPVGSPIGAASSTSQWGMLFQSPLFLIGIGLLVVVAVKR